MTLESIARSSSVRQLEVIIVDDGSNPEHGMQNVSSMFDFPITLCQIDKKLKDWSGPAVAHNKGILEARGEWILIQNAGVIHFGKK